MKNGTGLFSQIAQGFSDLCYIWWLEVKNTFKDEGMLIFFILVPIATIMKKDGKRRLKILDMMK